MKYWTRLSLTAISGGGVELISKLLPFLILHVVQKALGHKGFADAFFCISIIEVSISFVVFGYTHLGTLEFSKIKQSTPEATYSLFYNLIALRLINALGAAIVLWSLSFYGGYGHYKDILLPLLFFLFTSALDSTWVLTGTQKHYLFNFLLILGKMLSFLFILFLITSPSDSSLFAGLLLSANGFVNLTTFFVARKNLKQGYPQLSISSLKFWFIKACPYALFATLLVFIERVDVFWIERYLTSSEVAQYLGVSRMGHSLLQFFNTIVIAFFSEALFFRERRALQKHIYLSIFALFSAAILFLAIFFFFSAKLLTIIFDASFATMSSVLNIMILNAVLSAFILLIGLSVLLKNGRINQFSISLGLGFLVMNGYFYFLKDHDALSIVWGMFFGKIFCMLAIVYFARDLLFSQQKGMQTSIGERFEE